jgi:hypothetical protein
MTWLYLTAGLLIRTVGFLFGRKSIKFDLFFLGLAFFLGLIEALRAESFAPIPLILALTVAMIFRDRIVPTVNEGLLFLYSLLSLFFVYKLYTFNVSGLSVWSATLVCYFAILTSLMLYLCLSRKRLQAGSQVFLLFNFIFTSGFITYHTLFSFLLADLNPLNLVLIGYFGLFFASGIVYVLYFIPMRTGREQTKEQRRREIKNNIDTFQEKYLDTDIRYLHTVAIILSGILLVLNEVYLIVDWHNLFLLILFIGTFILIPKSALKHDNK